MKLLELTAESVGLEPVVFAFNFSFLEKFGVASPTGSRLNARERSCSVKPE